jgi:thioredoxin-like negative regulator of GroEL
MAHGVPGADVAGSFGSAWNDVPGMMGAGHAHNQNQIPQDVQQLIQKAEQALAHGNYQQAAQYLQQAAQAAGTNTPLGQELSQAAQALQQASQRHAPGANQQPWQADGSQNGGQSGLVPGSGQCGQNEGCGQQSGSNSQDVSHLLSVALNLISKGDSSDAKGLIRYALQQLSAQYPAYRTTYNRA